MFYSSTLSFNFWLVLALKHIFIISFTINLHDVMEKMQGTKHRQTVFRKFTDTDDNTESLLTLLLRLRPKALNWLASSGQTDPIKYVKLSVCKNFSACKCFEDRAKKTQLTGAYYQHRYILISQMLVKQLLCAHKAHYSRWYKMINK